MKSILSLAAAAVFIASPAFAADQDGGRTFTKGSKSYQSRSWGKDAQPQTPANAPSQQDDLGDVTKIAPAAGGSQPAETAAQPQDQGRSFREDMRLPRKN